MVSPEQESELLQSTRKELFLQALCSFGEARFAATGASMLPAIWPGDILMVRKCQHESAIVPGEVVLFERDGGLVAHRVVTRLESQKDALLVTRGDSHLRADPPVPEAEVIGVVFSVQRDGKVVSPTQSLSQRAVSLILRRSGACTRIALRLVHLRRLLAGGRTSWAS